MPTEIISNIIVKTYWSQSGINESFIEILKNFEERLKVLEEKK